MNEVVLQVKGISKSLGGKSILDNCSLNMKRGELKVLIGPSGAGKSTLMKILFGMDVIRETGGLKDSIHDSGDGYGNGFTFAGYNAHELYVACCNAQDAYNDKENWKNLVRHCMECDFSWDVSAKSYEGLYNETANLW